MARWVKLATALPLGEGRAKILSLLTDSLSCAVDRFEQLRARLVEEQRAEVASVRQRHLQQPHAVREAPN